MQSSPNVFRANKQLVKTYPSDAGYDIKCSESCTIEPRGSRLVSTGLVVAIPEGWYGRVASRSGWAVKKNIEVGAGVIDAHYRGEVKVLLRNHSDIQVHISEGDRVAQLIVTPIYTMALEVDPELNNETSTRGASGFGSSGN